MSKPNLGTEMNIILFGAGYNGINALKKLGQGKVAYFCDNDAKKQGQVIEGKYVLSFDEMLSIYRKKDNCRIMITPNNYVFLAGQLEDNGIEDYLLFPGRAGVHYQLNNGIGSKGKENNLFLQKIADESAEKDMLEDVSVVRKLSKEILKRHREQGLSLYRAGRLGESDFYGNLTTLIKYAGLDENVREFAPVVSHQDCMPDFKVEFQYKDAVIFSGSFYKEQIHKRFPYVPVFTIGPYIHYADGIYSAEEWNEKKQKIGKMLLVFLPHTIEGIEREFGKKEFLDEVIDRYRSRFDAIWLCVYWADLNDPICEYAKEKGMHIVTAGFRFDSNFNARLKTIIELSDAVVCGDIGTFISYSILLDKPIGRIDITDRTTIGFKELRSATERRIQFNETYQIYESAFYDIFDSDLRIDKRHREWMDPVAGFSLVRSKKYIRCIFDIARDIWILCRRDGGQYREAVRQAYYIYYEQGNIEKMAVLRDAAGWYLD